MRVRMNSSKELDDVPNSVSEDVKETIEPVKAIVDLITAASLILKNDDESVDYANDLIDRARRDMAQIDQLLAESQQIILGYIQTKSNLENPPAPAPAIIEPEPPPMPDEAIETLKEALGSPVEQAAENVDVLSR